VEIPNSPPTFNLTLDQLKEAERVLDKGEQLAEETKTKIDQDFRTILGNENYDQFKSEIGKINQEAMETFQDILTNFPPF
jgi:hypothetical protein